MEAVPPHVLLDEDVLEPPAAELDNMLFDDVEPLPFDVLLGHPILDVAPDEQAAGPDNAHFNDDGPLPFDVILGHPFLHAAPNQADPQPGPVPLFNPPAPDNMEDDFALGALDFALVQQEPAHGNQLGLINIAQVAPHQPDVVDGAEFGVLQLEHHLPPGLDAIMSVIGFLRNYPPELVAHPSGPGLVIELHAAVTDFMLAHEIPANAQAPPFAPQAGLPQDGLDIDPYAGDDGSDVANNVLNLPNYDQGAAGVEVHPPVQALVPDVVHVLHVEPVDAMPALGAVPAGVANNEEGGNAPHVIVPDEAPPPYPHPPAEAPGVLNEELEHEGPNDDGDHHVEEHPPPAALPETDNHVEAIDEHGQNQPHIAPHIGSTRAFVASPGAGPSNVAGPNGSPAHASSIMGTALDVHGRAAFSSLCTRFTIEDNLSNINEVLFAASDCIEQLQTSSSNQQRLPAALPPRAVASSSDHPHIPNKPKRSSKLREVWLKIMSRSSSPDAPGKHRAPQSVEQRAW
ncbi:unnamed protein product [Peniophora sp. CBMAI 1063]|nr:unnamed protein product [Peniophora sp. CBMAI 1063]